MTYLDKLMIRGIRSYSPDDSNSIQFHSPLTLIIGHNGTGKTTIIECLKYITTGDLPSNTKGGGFVYDPRLLRTSDVKAQVKLKFANFKNEEVVISRSLQLLNKKLKLEQKCIDSSITVQGNGERRSVTNRCCDVDSESCYHFGITRALLDNVIFCHQDEANWILSEPGNVKKRLDDILNTSVYAKALSELICLKKETIATLKAKRLEFSYISEMKNDHDSLIAHTKELRERLNAISSRLELFEKEEQEYNCIVIGLKTEIGRLEVVEATIRENTFKREHFIEIVNSYASFTPSDLQRRCLDELSAALSLKALELGNLMQLNENVKDRLGELKGMHTMEKNYKMKIDNMQLELDTYISGLYKCYPISVNALNTYTVSIALDACKIYLESLRSDLEEIQTEIKQIGADELLDEKRLCRIDIEVSNIELKIDETCRKIIAHEAAGVKTYDSSLLDALTAEYATLERKLPMLNESFSKSLTLAKSLKLKESMENKIALIKGKIEAIPYCTIRTESIEFRYDEVYLNNMKLIIGEKLRIYGKIGAYSSRLRCFLLYATESLELPINISINDFIQDSNTFKGFLGMLEQRDDIIRNLAENRSILGLYRDFQKLCLERKECVVCKKGLRPDEVSVVISRLRKMNFVIKDAITAKDIEFMKIDKEFRDEYTLEKLESLCIKLRMADNLRGIVEGGGGMYTMNDFLGSIKFSHGDLKNDMGLLCTNLELLQCLNGILLKLGDMVFDENIPLPEDLNQEIQGVQSKLSSIKRNLDVEVARRVEFDSGQLCKSRLGSKEDLQQERVCLENTRSAILEKRKKLVDSIALRGLTSLRETLDTRKEGIHRDISKVEYDIHTIVRIEDFIGKLRADLEQQTFKICQVKDEIGIIFKDSSIENVEELSATITRIKEEIIEIKTAISESNEHNRKIEMYEKVLSARNSIEEIDIFLASNDISVLDILREKINRVEAKHLNALKDQSFLIGEQRQIIASLRVKDKDLEKKSNVKTRYSDCFIELKSYEIALQDLEKLIRVLDKSIQQYQKSKMEEINKIIKDIWSGTYKGNDIDYIFIKCEGYETKAYNYQIMMVKNGVELEMRGRCSAGQRVLCCIVIRLALSEVFCMDCSILALDEPTTNLDRENIISLAETLLDIIKSRKQHKDFQLIIITHDENFVELLARENVDYFYRISKNDDGFSTIVQHKV